MNFEGPLGDLVVAGGVIAREHADAAGPAAGLGGAFLIGAAIDGGERFVVLLLLEGVGRDPLEAKLINELFGGLLAATCLRCARTRGAY